ncbi:alternative oxidase-domain-containing protein [Umbelopsis sp. AD052]|nr:alternative oxidase-domain-containing protein [Umbelopsis sp. AD052]
MRPIANIPDDIARELANTHPVPMRHEFAEYPQKITTEVLEKMDIGLGKHHVPTSFSDKLAYRLVKLLRILPDTYFRENHYMRSVMLETVAAVPGMVGAMQRHLRSLRKMTHDGGFISHLLHEAENERMHLMIWMKCLRPNGWNRLLVLGVQGVFFNAYFLGYMLSPRLCHRIAGYLEEEAVVSYTHFLEAIDKGIVENKKAPQIALEYYNLHPEATVRDVVVAVRADEALHRDANHLFSDVFASKQVNLRDQIKEQAEKQASAEDAGRESVKQ